MASIAWRPCSADLRMSPMPPSSPAMKIPATLVSKVGLTTGMSTPRRSVPNTSVIACTGQAAAHAPWPMQADGLARTALPPSKPIASSGHAMAQAPEPQHFTGSMTGCSEAGSVSPASRASRITGALSNSRRRRPRKCHSMMARSGTA